MWRGLFFGGVTGAAVVAGMEKPTTVDFGRAFLDDGELSVERSKDAHDFLTGAAGGAWTAGASTTGADTDSIDGTGVSEVASSIGGSVSGCFASREGESGADTDVLEEMGDPGTVGV